jgi:hypothetical protein
MQIDCFKEESITFKITNTDGDDAIRVFHSIISKCKNTAEKKGFNNMFSSEEKGFLKEFTDTIMDNET